MSTTLSPFPFESMRQRDKKVHTGIVAPMWNYVKFANGLTASVTFASLPHAHPRVPQDWSDLSRHEQQTNVRFEVFSDGDVRILNH
jgi:hypothetical protein